MNNDLNIAIEKNEKFTTANLGCFLRLPLTRHNMAFASLLCRMQMDASNAYPSVGQQLLRLEELYSMRFEATVQLYGKDLILSYLADFVEPQQILDPDYTYETVMETFAKLVTGPLLSKEVLELAQRQLADDYQTLMAEPSNYALAAFFDNWYASQPDYASSFMGPIDLIEDATVQEMNRFVASLPAMPVVFLGNAYDKGQVERLAKKYFNYKGLTREFADNALKIKAPKLDLEKAEVQGNQQAQLFLGYAYSGAGNLPDQITGLVLRHYLTGEQSSRLFTKVREENGAAYAVESSWYVDNSLFLINAGLDPEKVDRAKQIIIEEMKKVAAGRIDPGLLKQSKQALVNQTLLGQDQESWLLSKQLRGELKPEYAAFDQIKAAKAVTVNKLREFAQKLILNESYVLR